MRNILGYKPSVGAAIAAIAFYLVSTLLLHISYFHTFRGHKFMIVLLLGMIGESPFPVYGSLQVSAAVPLRASF